MLPCSPSDVGSVGLSAEDKAAFVVIDYDRSAMILVGSAFTDVETIKKALAALTAPSVLSRDALPLSARSVCYSVNDLTHGQYFCGTHALFYTRS